MKTETKEKIWFIILLLGLILFFATGCKPKQTINEKIVYKSDSTAIWKLETQLEQKELENKTLRVDLNRVLSENMRLNSEIFKLETFYDTSKPIVPETGKPPVSSEITTLTKSELERTIQEQVTIIKDFKKEVETLTTRNTNLELQVETLIQENKDLKLKTIPAFNLKSFLWGIAVGAVLIIVLTLVLRK